MSATDRVNAKLRAVAKAAGAGSAPPKLTEALSYALFPGGARVRPLICEAVAEACGADIPEMVEAAAASIELIHCASLVHDDLPCFDDADMRRSKPTVHKAFGEPIAVLTGDTMIVLAFETLAAVAVHEPARAAKLVSLLARFTGAPYGICAGQSWESEATIDLRAYHQAKTGALFMAATQMGAVAAGADPAAWEELGARIGEAFQVADDLRDQMCTADELGKPVKQDTLNNRPNAVRSLGLSGAKAHLDDVLGGAILSIPSCQGEAKLCAIISAQPDRLTQFSKQHSVA